MGPMSRKVRPRKTKLGTEVANVTRNSDTTFRGQKVKGQGHQAALLSAALTRKAAATVSVRTYSTWESTATLSSSAPTGGRRGAGHTVAAARLQLVVIIIIGTPLCDRIVFEQLRLRIALTRAMKRCCCQ